MAGNTRGRLKERFEGMHKNFEWIREHCSQSLELIGDKKPELSIAIKALAESVDMMDKLAQEIYGSL